MIKQRFMEVLLIEDNTDDVLLTQRALKEGKVLNHLHVVMDGEEALNFLFQKGEYKGVSTPDLIFLDLNLPKVDGRKVLAQIKSDPVLRRIPVVVLTTSKAEEDILRSYDLHANCYVTKPLDLEQFINVIKSIEDFWLTIVKLPNKD